MRRPPTPATLPPMSCTVSLQFTSTAEPVTGVVRAADGVESPFTGWLGLALALEIAIERATAAHRPPPTGHECR